MMYGDSQWYGMDRVFKNGIEEKNIINIFYGEPPSMTPFFAISY